jgi:hypothetical protein
MCLLVFIGLALLVCGCGDHRLTGSGSDAGSGRRDAGRGSADAGGGGCGVDATPTGTPPGLVPGVWQNITPPGIDLSRFGVAVVALDPGHPYTLYANSDSQGIFRTTDGGATWMRLGNPPATPDYGTSETYLDSMTGLYVDPCDSQHLYATDGVRGATLGFWVSHDGGNSWVKPPGWIEVEKMTTNDMGWLTVDPSDFRHILVSSHSPFNGLTNAGFFESKDAGESWVVHQPLPSWPNNTKGLAILYDPASGVGSSDTWLVSTDVDGRWRTSDAGMTWTQVDKATGQHGGEAVFRDSTGILYTGGITYPVRSKDNGVSWQELSNGVPSANYYAVISDGTLLYTSTSCACAGTYQMHPFYVSADHGDSWNPYPGDQQFINGPHEMIYDSVNGIIYAANWAAGVWALKVKR